MIVSRARTFLPARGRVAELIVRALSDLPVRRQLSAGRTVVVFYFVAPGIVTTTALVDCSGFVLDTHGRQNAASRGYSTVSLEATFWSINNLRVAHAGDESPALTSAAYC